MPSPSSPTRFGDDLQFHLALPPAPVELPAAVEVATYRIVTEAVTNVVRHAGAASCWLTIATGAAVEIDVVDDGVGIGDEPAAGVGLTAMRERASELGGTVSLLPNAPRGHARPRPTAGGAAVTRLGGTGARGHRRRPPDVPDGVGRGDPGDGRHRARRRGRSAPIRCRSSSSDAAPDVLLLDVRLGDASGLEVNRWLAEHHPAVKVIMLTMSEDHDTALTALRDGASGYLVKGAGPQRVEHALRTVAAGDVVLDHSLAHAVTELAQVRRSASSRPFPQLTQREFDILELVAEGLDNHTIARRLVLSPKTVRNHVSNVFAKIQATDRPHAIVLARRVGLGT